MIDTDDRELSILDNNKVLVENIPETGTKVHCYAISPDGTEYFTNSIRIDPREKKLQIGVGLSLKLFLIPH